MNATNAIKLNFNEYIDLYCTISQNLAQKVNLYKQENNVNILKPYQCCLNYHLESNDYKFLNLHLQFKYSIFEKYEFNLTLYSYIFENYVKKKFNNIFIPDILNKIIEFFDMGLNFEMIKNAQAINLIKNNSNDIYLCYKGGDKDTFLFDEIIKLTNKQPKVYLIEYNVYRVSTKNYDGTKIIDNDKSFCENCLKPYEPEFDYII